MKGASGYTHLAELKAAGGNTIRTWDTVNLEAILDEAQRNNLAVIAGLPLPSSDALNYFYKDTLKTAAACRTFKQVVQRYKDHPALLMWCLGNEPAFSFKLRYRPFTKTFNRLLDMIHDTDPDHPVTTTMVNFSVWQALFIKWKVHQLDVISFNIFGELNRLSQKLDKYAWLWKGPFLITEWGAYGPWEVNRTAWGAPIENTSTKKAEQYGQLYRYLPVNNPRFLGALVFYWGQKQEVTPTWFSLFDEKGRPAEAVDVIRALWAGQPAASNAPHVQYMLLNNKGAADNIMLRSDSVASATLLMQDTLSPGLSLHWEVWQEDWFSELRRPPMKIFDTVINNSGNKLAFKAPLSEGPYRIYVTALNSHGRFATANTPFYVVEQD
ncbi:glycoside hydrolase family 2 TIM barrel-domain containing protein [uncultured Chitinophaga sp.]|uniref:glycoside hydrolase family 2 TIM barrel-domain containing protein n=1 Tax=uncultured Chitinophaga sp. TaxID=339340 RepID=UPI002626D2E3|nr:glycoside hydrolase family 2 TIM barrel-domain containing protein [uncultured Chitinophaga sp.]